MRARLGKSKEKIRKYLPLLKEIFVIGMLLDMMFYFFSYFINISDYVIIKIFPLSGILILGLELYAGNKFFEKKHCKLILCVAISFGITCLIEYRHGFIMNCKTLFWLILYFCVFYTYDISFSDKTNYHKSIIRIFNFLILFNLLCCALSDIMYIMCFGILNIYKNFALGYSYYFGRLYGVTNDLSGSARIAVLSILFSVIICLMEKQLSRRWKIIYIVNGILSTIFLIGSTSRASYLLLAIAVAVFVFGIIFIDKCGDKKITVKIVKSSIGALISVSILLAVILILRRGCVYLPLIGSKWTKSIDFTTEDGYWVNNTQSLSLLEGGVDTAMRELGDTGHVEDVKSRTDNLRKLIEGRMIMGVGRDVDSYRKELNISDNASLASTLYINVFLYSGIIGGIIFFGGQIFIWGDCIYKISKNKCTTQSKVALMLLGTVLGLFSYTTIIYANDINSYIYWLLLGILVCYCENLVDGKFA